MLQQLIPPQLLQSKILVADDDEWNCAYIYEVLTAYGFQKVQSVSESSEVVGTVQREQPDILLLDIYMPTPDGFEILRQLKEQAISGPNLPILVITSDEDAAVKKRALELGASDFLPKPFEEIVVAARVANLLRVSKGGELRNRDQSLPPLSEESLKALLSKIPAGVVLVDEEGILKFANDEFCRLFSIQAEAEQLVGEAWGDAVEGLKEDFVDSQGFFESDAAIRRAGKPVDRELWVLQGNRVLERDYVPLVLEGGARGHLWIFRDVTMANSLRSGAASV